MTVDPTLQGQENQAVNVSLTPLPPPYITGMKLQEDIILGDLVLNKIDANNVVWVCTGIDGWWNQPDPEMPELTRGWGDGSYDVKGRWEARQLTLNGVFLPPDPSYVPAARDALVRATSLVYTGAWLRTFENPPRASYVRLSGRPEIETVNARGRTEFSIGLRAADPIKYEWNEEDPEGYSIAEIPCKNVALGRTGAGAINNIGNTSVTGVFFIYGPITGPATLQNLTTNELILVIDSLADSITRTVSNKALTSNVATITTSTAHGLAVDDLVTISGVDSTFNGDYYVDTVPSTTTFTFQKTAANVASTPSSGTVFRDADTLEINTYDHVVALNGETLGARSIIDTLADWIKLDPGLNNIVFEDEGNANSTSLLRVYYRSGWIA
jgi:hypothetical protein